MRRCWCLMDRGFDAGKFLREVAATNAQFLVRLTANRRPPVLGHLPDGSFVSLIGGVKVRIITARGDGHLPRRHPLRRQLPAGHHPARPPRLARGALIAFTTSAGNTRSPTSHCATPCSRAVCCAPATPKASSRRCGHCWPSTRRCVSPSPTPCTTVPGTDPDRASYQIAVETAQTLVTGARGAITAAADLAGDIGRAVLANLHGPRRPRVCARRVKSPLSTLEQAAARQTPHLPAHHRTDHRHQPGSPAATHDTPATVLDTDGRPITPRHCA